MSDTWLLQNGDPVETAAGTLPVLDILSWVPDSQGSIVVSELE